MFGMLGCSCGLSGGRGSCGRLGGEFGARFGVKFGAFDFSHFRGVRAESGSWHHLDIVSRLGEFGRLVLVPVFGARRTNGLAVWLLCACPLSSRGACASVLSGVIGAASFGAFGSCA
jgi:hypothetical protein